LTPYFGGLLKISKGLTNNIMVIICGLALGVGLAGRFSLSCHLKGQISVYWTPAWLIPFIASLILIRLFYWLFSLLLSRTLGFNFSEVLYYASYSFLPLVFMLLTFWQQSFFISLGFFRDNNDILLLLCILR